MHLAQYFRSGLIMPPLEKSVLERDIQPDIEQVSFSLKDGSQTTTLKDYLHEGGPRRVQCMMMAHKGKVVFEAYPGMNPTDAHVWISSSKPTTSILTTLLEQQGLFSYDDPVTKHVPQLVDLAWEKVSYRNAANMSAGLDIEARVPGARAQGPKSGPQGRSEALRYQESSPSIPSSRMRVILDTNVLMSGIFFARPPATILAAWAEGELELLASVDILTEYRRVGSRLGNSRRVS